MIIGNLPPITEGSHTNAGEGACIMEMVSFLNGDEWTDYPTCTYKVISSLAQTVNDYIDNDKDRQLIATQFDRLFGTAEIGASPDVEIAFMGELCHISLDLYMKHYSGLIHMGAWVEDVREDIDRHDYSRAWLSLVECLPFYEMENEELISYLSAVLDIADKVLERTEYPVIDVTPLQYVVGVLKEEVK